MTRLVFRKGAAMLRPIDAAGEKFMRRIEDGDLVTLEARVPRNIRLHNKYWALCAFLAHHSSKLRSAEEASDYLKIGAGHARRIETLIGPVYLPQSISFAKMDQQAFDAFWDRVCAFVLQELFPHLAQSDLEAELAEFVGAGAIWAHDK